MLESDIGDKLTDGRPVFLILRLVLDRNGRLRSGVLLDSEATQQGRFVTLIGLTDAVNRWLERQRRHSPPRLE